MTQGKINCLLSEYSGRWAQGGGKPAVSDRQTSDSHVVG